MTINTNVLQPNDSLTLEALDPALEVLDDADYLTQLIVRGTGTEIRDVIARLRREQRHPGITSREQLKQLGIKPHVWSSELIDFYSESDAYLYENIWWNRSPTKRDIRRWISRRLALQLGRRGRVLVCGDGLGFDSQYLSRAGHQVDYFEVSAQAAEFASELFVDFDSEVRILRELDENSGEYDAVVCLDVLEHVPDPVSMTRELAGYLRPDGLLIVHAPFWMIGPEVSTHLESNRRFSGDLRRMFRANNLRPLAAELFWNPIALCKADAHAAPRATMRDRLWVQFGGLLLSAARFWSLPHVWTARMLSERREWPELDELSDALGPDRAHVVS